MTDILVTICARGGSKGLPGKHLRTFAGKPLVDWTLFQAQQWGRGKADIVLSSDDDEILDRAGYYGGVGRYKRPDVLANDDTPKLDAIRDCVGFMGGHYDHVVDLDATNPCRFIDNIEACYQTCVAFNAPVSFSVVPARRSPYFNQIERMDGAVKLPIVKNVTRRQDAPSVYDMNASIYCYTKKFLNSGEEHPVVSSAFAYEMPEWSFCDIDSEVDFGVCEFLFEKYVLGVG